MSQLCARSGCWGLWKLLLWFQVRVEQVESVARCVSSCTPLLFFLPSFLPHLFCSVLWCCVLVLVFLLPLDRPVCDVSSPGSVLVLVLVLCSVVCVVLCVLCHRVCSVCDPPLLQIYNRVCGPRECVRPENLQGSASSQNYFCHTRWESV